MNEQRGMMSPPGGTGTAQEPTTDGDMLILSYVLSGILFYGALGWLGSTYLHQSWMLPLGLVCGLSASMYLIIKRFGSHQ